MPLRNPDRATRTLLSIITLGVTCFVYTVTSSWGTHPCGFGEVLLSLHPQDHGYRTGGRVQDELHTYFCGHMMLSLYGRPIKIDSVQDVITLRCDLRDAWDNYEFREDPNNNYRITAFTNGSADVNVFHLQLDHIQDLTLRPLGELIIDRFMQGLREPLSLKASSLHDHSGSPAPFIYLKRKPMLQQTIYLEDGAQLGVSTT